MLCASQGIGGSMGSVTKVTAESVAYAIAGLSVVRLERMGMFSAVEITGWIMGNGWDITDADRVVAFCRRAVHKGFLYEGALGSEYGYGLNVMEKRDV